MPIPASCSSCGWHGKLKDEFAGKRGRCPACREIIQVPVPESEAEYGDYEVVDDDPPPKPALSKRAHDDDENDRPSRSRLRDDDDEGNQPRSRRRNEDEDDESSRPKSRFHKRVDDEDERPRSRRRDEDEEDNRPRSRRRDDDDERGSKPRTKIKKKKKKDDSNTEQQHQLTGTAAMFAGVGMMIGAVVWFVLGLVYQDKIYFYPPVLFVLGIGAFIRGMQEESDRH